MESGTNIYVVSSMKEERRRKKKKKKKKKEEEERRRNQGNAVTLVVHVSFFSLIPYKPHEKIRRKKLVYLKSFWLADNYASTHIDTVTH